MIITLLKRENIFARPVLAGGQRQFEGAVKNMTVPTTDLHGRIMKKLKCSESGDLVHLPHQAIAPLWEANAANAQRANSLSNVGLSEIERAANLGHLTQGTAPGVRLDWSPIALSPVSKCYKIRSCSRMYLLCCSTKTHPKTTEKFSRAVTTTGRRRIVSEKTPSLIFKCDCSPTFSSVNSYEIKSKFTVESLP